jgi:putative NADH-flavin reductase/uncharacterized protein YciI
MRILVIGATGGTGREVVRQALLKGLQVNALARSGSDAATLLPGADIIEGDALNSEVVAEALTGCNAVISALGTKLAPFHEETLLSTATRVLINVMQKQGITRLICITGIGAGDSHGHGGFLYDHIAQPLLLSSTYHDKNRQEDEIRNSGLDWTIVRPTNLTNGPATDSVRALTDLSDFHGGSIARSDVASFLITELEDRYWAGKSPVITSVAPTKHPKLLYAMLRHTEDGAKLHELLPEHLEWMHEHEKAGHIFLSGPTEQTAGSEINGLTIIKAASREAADALALQDPLIRAGAVTYSMNTWNISEGRITLNH